jgi:hypothetical protein
VRFRSLADTRQADIHRDLSSSLVAALFRVQTTIAAAALYQQRFAGCQKYWRTTASVPPFRYHIE